MTLKPADKIDRIKAKEIESGGMDEYLPGLGPVAPEMGALESATRRTVRYLQSIDLVTPADEAVCVLAIEAAEIWDKNKGNSKLSGQAMYLNAVNSIFEQLPKVEKAVTAAGATIDDLISSIMENPAPEFVE